MRITYSIIIIGILILSGILVYFTSAKNNSIPQGQIDEYNYIIGTQTVGSKYKFTDETMLVETAKQIKLMGSNLLKFAMTSRYSSENYGLPHNDEITSLTKLAQLEPSFKAVLDMDFKYYHIWVYGFSQYTPEPEGEKIDTNQVKFINGYPDHYAEALYEELYDFASYLLTTYNNSGKIFYLGNWEGDWHLRWNYNLNAPVEPKTLEGMLKWLIVRQKAIDDAKRDIKHENVELYHYIEVNQVMIGLDESRKCVTNTIVNKVNPDYVSYSAYDATNPHKTEQDLNTHLKRALDYIEQHLSPKEGLPEGKRVWIGEYGNPARIYSEEMQDTRSRWTIKAGLEWGAPFILYWELYNNEINKATGEQGGFWLIDDAGDKQKIWHTHTRFYEEARIFLQDFLKEHGELPEISVFQENAAKFDALNQD